MVNAGASIEAFLKLDATQFRSGIDETIKYVDKFKTSMMEVGKESDILVTGTNQVSKAMKSMIHVLNQMNEIDTKTVNNFKQLSMAIEHIATAVQRFSADAQRGSVGIESLNTVIGIFKAGMEAVEIPVINVTNAVRNLARANTEASSSTASAKTMYESMVSDLNNVAVSLQRMGGEYGAMSDAEGRAIYQTQLMKNEFREARRELINFAMNGVEAFNSVPVNTYTRSLYAMKKELLAVAQGVQQFNAVATNVYSKHSSIIRNVSGEYARLKAEISSTSEAYRVLRINSEGENVTVEKSIEKVRRHTEELRKNGQEKLRSMGWTGGLAAEETELSASTDKTNNSLQRQSSQLDKTGASMNRMSTQASRLKNALSTLKTMGTLVASMFAYNFAHKLLIATTETVHSKSEMEGYFKMLRFSQNDIDDFNKALDETVQKFQRVNKYSLGETISSIGVEFNLTTEEMKKAMNVTSMITSEYLRAGRNANEASLAVKDVLQGQFQRLSRETGVKGEQLKEAGWSGDTTDVLGLMEALEKVGKSRNWDVFAAKANSLNDIITILQNRFGEWSADMVNVVQPTIVNAFNSIMSFSEGLSQSLSGLWKWLNGNSWGATASKIGMVTSAVLLLMPSLTAWRSGATLLQVANMSLGQSLAALVLGINAETLANNNASESIAMRLLGIQAEQLEDATLIEVINGMIVSRNAEAVATDLANASNLGFVGGLTAVITGETIAEGTTIGLTGALGMLTAAFLTSPIGWFTVAILGLASAFYVLTGGLDESWSKMKEFNEIMQDTGTAQKEAQQWLNQIKEDVGEDSEEFKKAKDSVDDFTSSLQSASYWYNHSKTAFQGMDLKVNTNSEDVLKKYGLTDEQVTEYNNHLSALTLGKDKYYHAEQVYNKQIGDENSNFVKDLDDYLAKIKKNGGDIEAESEKFTQNYKNLAEHSYIANTSDDWWEWMWNSFYAGMDQFWIDWDNFWADPQWNSGIDGLIKGLGSFNGIKGLLDGLGINGDSITGFFNDIGSFFEGKTLMELLGLKEDHDYAKDFVDFVFNGASSLEQSLKDFFTSLPDPVSMIGEWIANGGSDTSWVDSWVNDSIISPLGDALYNGLKTIPLVGALITLIESITDENLGATLKGGEIGKWIGDGLNEAVNNIPILGDVKRLLESVTQSSDDTNQKFQQNANSITNSAVSLATNVSSSYTSMKNTHKSSLDSMSSTNSKTFDEIKNHNTTTLSHMRDTTSKTTSHVQSAFSMMSKGIISSSDKLKTNSTNDFISLGNVIQQFYKNIQNPATWTSISFSKGYQGSAGYKGWSKSPRPSTARKMFGKHGAGVNPYESSNQKVSLKDLMSMIGEDKKVSLSDFLSMFTDSGFGWDFSSNHFNHIKNKADSWKTAPAYIRNIGNVGRGYDVSRFRGGHPTFTFDEFLDTAESIFSVIPYKFYMDSNWKGNWINALMSGATNCSDGTDALIALASLFGFSGEKVHTTLGNGVGHFYAVINGRALDTTHFQNSRSWSPLGGAGTPVRSGGSVRNISQPQKTVTVNIDMSNTNIYGVDDLEAKMQEAVKKGMREEFNDAYTIAI